MSRHPTILIAPNALKGSLSAGSAARAIASGITRAIPDAGIRLFPVADGGDGLLEVIAGAVHGARMTSVVTGPLGEPLSASWLYIGDRKLAVLETAQVAGLALLRPEQLDPLRTTTRGLGELILKALDAGARQILIGIGGSATNDGGIGMASALGVVFRDEQDQAVPPLAENLSRISRLDTSGLDPRLRDTDIRIACDVSNPLLGPRGATRTYGAQKGADSDMRDFLEAGLGRLSDLIETQLGIRVSGLPGAGAAGGVGAAAAAFLGAELQPGAELVLDLLDIAPALEGVDLVVTAEGRLDHQTLQGKAPAAVASRALARGIPCIALAGSLGDNLTGLHAAGFTSWFTILPGPMTPGEAMRAGHEILADTSEQLARTWLACWRPPA